MNFSEKQFALIKFFLQKLNFSEDEVNKNDSFTRKYLNYLAKSYIQFKNIGTCDNSENLLPYFKYTFDGKIYKIDEFTLINYLQLEIKIKESQDFIIHNDINLNITSATDIANFTYCPVNYSISKSFSTKKIESAEIGTEKHSDSYINKLVKKKEIYPTESYNNDFDYNESDLNYDENFIELKEFLKDYEILYSGHNENVVKYFKNDKGNFVGQPDFILKNIITNEIIVIEEKYQFIPSIPVIKDYSHNYYDGTKAAEAKITYENIMESINWEGINEKRNKNYFYQNHINQLKSYLYGISEYPINKAILIYWKYEIKENLKIVTKCYYKIIDKSQEVQDKQELNNIFKQIKKLNKESKTNYHTQNPLKCATCVNNFLCGHKTGKFEYFTIPYKLDFIEINNKVPFPDILKKTKDDVSPKRDSTPEITWINGYNDTDLTEQVI